MKIVPKRFIVEEIKVQFNQPPILEKTPSCPGAFFWKGRIFYIMEELAEWSDFTRRGRMSSNMQPEHAALAAGRGSLGVGRFYFRVRTDTCQIFDLYYDRAPKSADDRKGHWFLYRELITK